MSYALHTYTYHVLGIDIGGKRHCALHITSQHELVIAVEGNAFIEDPAGKQYEKNGETRSASDGSIIRIAHPCNNGTWSTQYSAHLPTKQAQHIAPQIAHARIYCVTNQREHSRPVQQRKVSTPKEHGTRSCLLRERSKALIRREPRGVEQRRHMLTHKRERQKPKQTQTDSKAKQSKPRTHRQRPNTFLKHEKQAATVRKEQRANRIQRDTTPNTHRT